MGLFKQQKQPVLSTLIGSEATIRGDLIIRGGVHVDGIVKGAVISSGDKPAILILSEQGVIEGDVKMPRVVLNGVVTGDVYAGEKVELGPKAKVTGTVYYRILEMASGAQVNGQLVHSVEPTQRMLQHDQGKEWEKGSGNEILDVDSDIDAENT